MLVCCLDGVSFDEIPGMHHAQMQDHWLQIGSARFATDFPENVYSKDDIQGIVFDKVDQLSSSFANLIDFDRNLIRVIPNLFVPHPSKIQEFTFSIDTVSSYAASSELPEDHDFSEFPVIEDIPDECIDLSSMQDGIAYLSSMSQEASGVLSTTLDAFDLSFYAYLKFYCIDSWSESSILPNKIFINNVPVNFTHELEDGKFWVTIKAKVTQPYKLTIKKTGYANKNIFLMPKIAHPGYMFDPLIIGEVQLLNITSALTYTLEWGAIPPDLDLHVYSFDENWTQVEHVYFKKMKETQSFIFLDYDDQNSYGPENVQIFNPDPNKYYLFTVHNYSLRRYANDVDAHMNYKGSTRMTIKYHNREIYLSPCSDGTYKTLWWDAFIIHNDRIFVIDSISQDSRTTLETMDFNGNKYARESIKEKLENARFSISLNDLKNSPEDIDASLKID